jgi:hypothetical protein
VAARRRGQRLALVDIKKFESGSALLTYRIA